LQEVLHHTFIIPARDLVHPDDNRNRHRCVADI
jgi:hypothetical protein